jgi:hypothetical protein
VEWTLGILLAAGHDPAHLLASYSFDQLALYARCILGHHVRMLDLILRPVLGAQGVEWKDHNVPRPAGRKRPRTDAENEQREAALLQRLSSAPFGMRTVQTSGGDAAPGADD